MDMRHFIKFETPIDVELYELLSTKGARPHSDPMDWLMPSSAVSEEIETQLRERGVPFEVFFDLQPSAGDDLGDLAAYLWLEDFDDVALDSTDLVLAWNEEMLAIVASDRLISMIGSVTSRPSWASFKGRGGYSVLEGAPELPDPVEIPRAIFLSEGMTGSWAVQSDGREFLTSANLEVIKESGIVYAPYCSVANKVLRWNRPPIFGGSVLALLRDNQVLGIGGPPVFLGKVVEN